MIKILFVCHGNICRSPMAEFIMKDMVNKIGVGDEYYIDSAAVSSEELGNPVYPPAERKLREHGLTGAGKTARRINARDYERFDLIIGMDETNMYRVLRSFGGDPDGKVHNLLDFAGRIGQEISDPYYSGDFDATWNDLQEGCLALLNMLERNLTVTLDFSAVTGRADFYRVMRRAMLWQDEYGNNLDALNDILTGLPYFGKSFILTEPADTEWQPYYEKIVGIFDSAGVTYSLQQPQD